MPSAHSSRHPRWHRRCLPVLLLLGPGCALPGLTGRSTAPAAAERLAAQVTIHRDAFGVPHIHGATDEAVAFGIAWAQAEDNLWQIEEDYVHALGRASYLYGEVMLEHDVVRAAFDVERLSRAEYDAQSPELRRLLDAYAAGLNHFVATQPEQRMRVLPRFEPWHPLLLDRAVTPNTVVDGVRLGEVAALVGAVAPGTAASGGGAAGERPLDLTASASPIGQAVTSRSTGASTAWAVAPSRSASGHALLLQGPHGRFFGAGQHYELRLASDEGWTFAGVAMLATPFPRIGHNDRVGWTHTASGADAADAYLVDFSHPTDPLLYRHGGEWQHAEERTVTIAVNSQDGVHSREFRFVRTHHGPLVAERGGRSVAVRIARFEEGGSLAQWYAMGRARTFDEFLAALDQRAFRSVNTMYADADGNIFYVHGNAVPRRSPGVDPGNPVDGTDPDTGWQGLHELDALPQLRNPESGWLQSAGGTPFLATADGHNLDPGAYPAYMAPEPDHPRARVSRRILAGDPAWTLDALADAAFDTRAIEAEHFVTSLVDEWERLGVYEPERALRIEARVDALREWDQRMAVESTAATHFLLAFQQLQRAEASVPDASPDAASPGEVPHVTALERALEALHAEWGTVQVPWGEMNRLQRVHTRSREGFRDYAHSLPVAGAPGEIGIVFSFFTSREQNQRRRYGTAGPAWLGIVQFGAAADARSVVPFGQSADPRSPHYFDQATLYAEGRFKPVHTGVASFAAAAARSYQPGDRPAASESGTR